MISWNTFGTCQQPVRYTVSNGIAWGYGVPAGGASAELGPGGEFENIGGDTGGVMTGFGLGREDSASGDLSDFRDLDLGEVPVEINIHSEMEGNTSEAEVGPPDEVTSEVKEVYTRTTNKGKRKKT